MAKKRSRSVAKKKTKAKSSRKRATKRAKKPTAPPTHLELRQMRQFAQRHIAIIESHPSPSTQALEVKESMQQLLTRIEGHCGPNMTVPI